MACPASNRLPENSLAPATAAWLAWITAGYPTLLHALYTGASRWREQDALRDCERETHGTRREILAILIFFFSFLHNHRHDPTASRTRQPPESPLGCLELRNPGSCDDQRTLPKDPNLVVIHGVVARRSNSRYLGLWLHGVLCSLFLLSQPRRRFYDNVLRMSPTSC